MALPNNSVLAKFLKIKENTMPDNNAPKNETAVFVMGTLKMDPDSNEKVAVIAKTDPGETLLLIDKPAKLGNALTVGKWLNDAWNTEVDALLVRKVDPNDPSVELDEIESPSNITKDSPALQHHLQKKNLPNALSALLTADVTLEDLYIRKWTEENSPPDQSNFAFKFAMSVTFPGGFDLFASVKLMDVYLGITNAPKNFKFPENKVVLPRFETAHSNQLEKQAKALPVQSTPAQPTPAQPTPAQPTPAQPVGDAAGGVAAN